MTWFERSRMVSAAQCCVCDHRLSVPELEEFRGRVDEELHGEAHCRTCMETHLLLCRECSCRYTSGSGGICSECSARLYGMVG